MPTLDWLNRAAAFTTAAKVPYRLLEPIASYGSTAPDNLLIQGDNLEALKALLPFYRASVKCIFIDPPYNTKSAFEHYDDNLEHAQWLSMLLPRLQLLRELLREDGSIWVTIDDNEGHYLKVLMDEVFGRGNFVANVVWQKKYAVKNDSEFFSESHDHILMYARSVKHLHLNREKRSADQEERYTNPDNDPRGAWTSGPLQRNEFREYAYFPVRTPSGKEHFPPKGTSWRYTTERMAELIADNRIWFGPSGANVPRLKRFLSEVADTVAPTTWWDYKGSGHNDEARREAKLITDDVELFGTPKPERVAQKIIDFATHPNDLVLDSFLGSGTTAAVAHKMGRRWIGIEMGAHAATHCLPRLQKVVDGEQGGISKSLGWAGGGGFRFMRLGETVFDDYGSINPSVRFATLAAFIWQQETGTTWPGSPTERPTPFLGNYYKIDSYLRIQNMREEPISPSNSPPTAYYLLYNGILGDKRPASGNVLTREVLDALLTLHATSAPSGTPLVVFGESVRLGPARLEAAQLTFKQIPYDVRAR